MIMKLFLFKFNKMKYENTLIGVFLIRRKKLKITMFLKLHILSYSCENVRTPLTMLEIALWVAIY